MRDANFDILRDQLVRKAEKNMPDDPAIALAFINIAEQIVYDIRSIAASLERIASRGD